MDLNEKRKNESQEKVQRGERPQAVTGDCEVAGHASFRGLGIADGRRNELSDLLVGRVDGV